MFETIKSILDVVKTLLGLSDKLKAARRERRADMATLFEQISNCLASVSAEIRVGGVPHGRCGELITYADALPAVIEQEVGPAKATELGKALHSGYAVEQLAIQLRDVPDREPHLAQIEEASGKFRALANLVRVGG